MNSSQRDEFRNLRLVEDEVGLEEWIDRASEGFYPDEPIQKTPYWEWTRNVVESTQSGRVHQLRHLAEVTGNMSLLLLETLEMLVKKDEEIEEKDDENRRLKEKVVRLEQILLNHGARNRVKSEQQMRLERILLNQRAHAAALQAQMQQQASQPMSSS